MTKKELIEKLKDLPDDTRICVQKVDEDVYTPWIGSVEDVEIECDGSDGCEAEVLIW